MIFIDRILRYMSKDIYLPLRCYATKKECFSKTKYCRCKNFCKYPPNKGLPEAKLILVKEYKEKCRL